MDYLPELYSLTGLMFYTFIGYSIIMTLAYYCSPKDYTIEDYREAVRKNRKDQ